MDQSSTKIAEVSAAVFTPTILETTQSTFIEPLEHKVAAAKPPQKIEDDQQDCPKKEPVKEATPAQPEVTSTVIKAQVEEPTKQIDDQPKDCPKEESAKEITPAQPEVITPIAKKELTTEEESAIFNYFVEIGDISSLRLAIKLDFHSSDSKFSEDLEKFMNKKSHTAEELQYIKRCQNFSKKPDVISKMLQSFEPETYNNMPTFLTHLNDRTVYEKRNIFKVATYDYWTPSFTANCFESINLTKDLATHKGKIADKALLTDPSLLQVVRKKVEEMVSDPSKTFEELEMYILFIKHCDHSFRKIFQQKYLNLSETDRLTKFIDQDNQDNQDIQEIFKIAELLSKVVARKLPTLSQEQVDFIAKINQLITVRLNFCTYRTKLFGELCKDSLPNQKLTYVKNCLNFLKNTENLIEKFISQRKSFGNTDRQALYAAEDLFGVEIVQEFIQIKFIADNIYWIPKNQEEFIKEIKEIQKFAKKIKHSPRKDLVADNLILQAVSFEFRNLETKFANEEIDFIKRCNLFCKKYERKFMKASKQKQDELNKIDASGDSIDAIFRLGKLKK
ncbi:MAG: hypothetical protein H0W88_06645 [Parachlamydiaceae bacterium]|nr:hypothetical protein [Parachlamydiaceae bacterium]